MSYRGGKNGAGVYQRIICEISKHETYIEPFLGGGAIMRMKLPAPVMIGVDVDKNVLKNFGKYRGTDNIELFHMDGIEFLRLRENDWPPKTTMIYCDPPYPRSVRKNKQKIYKFEMSDEQHEELLSVLLTMQAAIAISSYPNALYESRLKSWRKISFQTTTRGNTHAIECLWMNYPEPLELHDYRYLGKDFRERERIKRMQQRWKARLARMKPIECHAMMSTIEDFRKGEY